MKKSSLYQWLLAGSLCLTAAACQSKTMDKPPSDQPSDCQTNDGSSGQKDDEDSRATPPAVPQQEHEKSATAPAMNVNEAPKEVSSAVSSDSAALVVSAIEDATLSTLVLSEGHDLVTKLEESVGAVADAVEALPVDTLNQ
ncbi:MAG: hypothetical protein HY861_05040 [Chlamydiia bacterium]|nr:hypothetical protein [Chlamydiia bacterium]